MTAPRRGGIAHTNETFPPDRLSPHQLETLVLYIRDNRRTFTAHCAEMGANPDLIAALLAREHARAVEALQSTHNPDKP